MGSALRPTGFGQVIISCDDDLKMYRSGFGSAHISATRGWYTVGGACEFLHYCWTVVYGVSKDLGDHVVETPFS